MNQLLQELKDTGLVKVTGSYADGTQTEDSDIDFYVKEDHPEHRCPEPTNMDRIKEVLAKHNIKWTSTIVGYIFTHKSDNPNIEREMEFSDLFNHRDGRDKEININGVVFSTH